MGDIHRFLGQCGLWRDKEMKKASLTFGVKTQLGYTIDNA